MKLKKILNLSSAVLMGISTIPINVIINPTIVCATGEEGEATKIKLTVHLTNGQRDFGFKTIPVKTDLLFSEIKKQFAQLFGVDHLTILFEDAEIDDEMTLDDLEIHQDTPLDATTDATEALEPQQPAPSEQEQPTAIAEAQPQPAIAVGQTSVAGTDIGTTGPGKFSFFSKLIKANPEMSKYFEVEDYYEDCIMQQQGYSIHGIENSTLGQGVITSWHKGINGHDDIAITCDHNHSILVDPTKFSPEQQEVIDKLRQGEAVDYKQLPFQVPYWEQLQKMYQITDGGGNHFTPRPEKLMFVFFKIREQEFCLPFISIEKIPENIRDFYSFCKTATPQQIPELRTITKSVFDALLTLHQHKFAYGSNIDNVLFDPTTKKVYLFSLVDPSFSKEQSRSTKADYQLPLTSDNNLIIKCLERLCQNDQSKLGRLLKAYDQVSEDDSDLLRKSDKLLAVIKERLGNLDQADQEVADQAFYDQTVQAFKSVLEEMKKPSSEDSSQPETVPARALTVAEWDKQHPAQKPQPRTEEPSVAKQSVSTPVAPPKPTLKLEEVTPPKKRAFTAPALLGDCNSVDISNFVHPIWKDLSPIRFQQALDSMNTEVGQQVAQFFQIKNFAEPYFDRYNAFGLAGYTRNDQTKITMKMGAQQKLDYSKFNAEQLKAVEKLKRGESVDFNDCLLPCPEYADLCDYYQRKDGTGNSFTPKPGKILFVFYKLKGVEYYCPIFSMEKSAGKDKLRQVFEDKSKYTEDDQIKVLQSLLDLMINLHQDDLMFDFDSNDILVDPKTHQVSLSAFSEFHKFNKNEDKNSAHNQDYSKRLARAVNAFFRYVKDLKLNPQSKLSYLYHQYFDDPYWGYAYDPDVLKNVLSNFRNAIGGDLTRASQQMAEVDLTIELLGKDYRHIGQEKIKVAIDVPFSKIKEQLKAKLQVSELEILFDFAEVEDEMTLDDLDYQYWKLAAKRNS